MDIQGVDVKSAGQVDPRPVRLAGLWHRAFAYAVDCVPIGLASLFFSTAVGGLDWSRVPPDGRWGALDQVVDTINDQSGAMVWLVLGFMIAQVIYGSVFESLGGRTPGKWIFKLRVIDPNGQSVGLVRGTGRNVFKVMSVLGAGLGALWVGFSVTHQALHDHLATTYVERITENR